jgi:hypothetical protein
MFEKETRIETAFAVRYHEDGQDKMLLRGRRGLKMFASYSRALKALNELGQSGEVVEVSVNEVTLAQPHTKRHFPELVMIMGELTSKLQQRDGKVSFYKADVITDAGYNVIRHTPLGSKPIKEPGDTYVDVDLHLQLRINT